MPSMRRPNFALLLGLAWLLAAIQLLAQNWTDTALTLADTDDAMRLAQLRGWLRGEGRFDMREGGVAGGVEVPLVRRGEAGGRWARWGVGLFVTTRPFPRAGCA